MTTEATKTEVGSYFISNYPPFSVWNVEQLPDLQATLNQPPGDRPLGLYIHIPFCRKRCKFCYFRVYTDKNAKDIETYVQALEKEMDLVSQLPVRGNRPFRFVYFGGGTPSYLSSKQLTALVDRLRHSADWEQAEEVTFECEPGTLSETKLATLKDLGVTRLSLGVEHYDDHILEENGRAHLSAEIFRAWEWIQRIGFPNVNIDLIAGMVGETEEKWHATIRQAIAMAPDSVTIYQMELPFNTVYSKDILGKHMESPVADWPTKRKWINDAFDAFLANGYHISSAYTLIKDPSRVSFSYRDHLWQGSDLLATGVASFGHLQGVHYQNQPEWADYLAALLDRAELPLYRAMCPTPHQLLVRELVLQLKKGWVAPPYFQRKFGVDVLAEWQTVWQAYEQAGWVTCRPDRISLSRPGLLRVDALLPAFFELQHQGVRYT